MNHAPDPIKRRLGRSSAVLLAWLATASGCSYSDVLGNGEPGAASSGAGGGATASAGGGATASAGGGASNALSGASGSGEQQPIGGASGTSTLDDGGEASSAGASGSSSPSAGAAGDGPTDSGVICQGDRIVLSVAAYEQLVAERCREITGGLQMRVGNLGEPPGLETLEKIGDFLIVQANPGLTSLETLSHLTRVGAEVLINGNSNLTSLRGLRGLTEVKSWIRFQDNPLVKDADGLGGLKHATFLELQGPFTSLQGLNLETADYLIVWNTNITTLDGLQSLRSVERLDVFANPSLQSLTALSGIAGVGSSISVEDSPLLSSLAGIDHLTELEQLSLSGLPALTSLHELAVLRSIGDLSIGGVNFTSLSDLQALESVQHLHLQNNSGMTSLAGLERITHLDSLQLFSNPQLASLDALSNLTACDEGLDIQDNAVLQNLQGLEHVQQAGTLNIKYNPALESIAGLTGLQHAESLDISYNAKLTSLTGLEHVTRVDYMLSLLDNPKLQGLAPLLAWPNGTVAGSLQIMGNTLLPQCEVDAFVPTQGVVPCEFCLGNDATATCN